MSDLFSSGAFGLLPMLLSGGSSNKGGGASAMQMPTPSMPRAPVNANMNPAPNYWNGNNFVIPGYSNAPATSQIPQSMLPSARTGALSGLNSGQLSALLAQVLKPGQSATPPPAQAPLAPQVQPQGMAMGGGMQNLQSILDRLRSSGALGNQGIALPHIGMNTPGLAY